MVVGIGRKSDIKKYFKAKFLIVGTMGPFGDTRVNFRSSEYSKLDFMYIFLRIVNLVGFANLSAEALYIA